MKARSILERVLLISLMTVPLWLRRRRSGECSACGGDFPPCPPPPVPPHCVSTDSPVILADPPVPLNCMVVAATFTPENNSWTYFFDPNNSIKITTKVNFPFELVVDLIPHTQAAYQARVVSTPFEGSTLQPYDPRGIPCLMKYALFTKCTVNWSPGAYGNGIENLLVVYFARVDGPADRGQQARLDVAARARAAIYRRHHVWGPVPLHRRNNDENSEALHCGCRSRGGRRSGRLLRLRGGASARAAGVDPEIAWAFQREVAREEPGLGPGSHCRSQDLR